MVPPTFGSFSGGNRPKEGRKKTDCHHYSEGNKQSDTVSMRVSEEGREPSLARRSVELRQTWNTKVLIGEPV